MRKIKVWSNNLINIPLMVLTGITIMGVISQLNISFQKTSVTYISTVILLLISYVFCRKFNLNKIFNKYEKKIWIISFILLFVWQIYMLATMNINTNWDTAINLQGAMQIPNTDYSYFSRYPNNIFILMFEHVFWLMMNKPSLSLFIFELGTFNVILLDLSLILFKCSLQSILKKRVVNIAIILMMLLVAVSPWITIIYSDIPAFIISLTSLSIFILINHETNMHKKWIETILLALLATIGYLVKPSVIIFFIAIFIILIIKYLQHEGKFDFKKIFVAIILFGGLTCSFTQIIKHNSLFKYDSNASFSMLHYAAMGLHNTGGYYGKDVIVDGSLKNQAERNRRDLKVIGERLQSFRYLGNYQTFLFNKQDFNSQDATWNWPEGEMILLKDNSSDPITHKLFLLHGVGAKKGDFWFSMQIIWLFSLIGVLFSFFDISWKSQILKYTIVGFFMFLLIFEAGRSRYMIQFMPFILVLASIGIDRMMNWEFKYEI